MSGPPGISGPPGMSGPPPSFVSPPSGPRRPRYVDTFNTGAAPPARKQSAPSPARQLNFEGTIFTPMAVSQEQPLPQAPQQEATEQNNGVPHDQNTFPPQ